MSRKKRIKVIIDTNLFISFLIGKRLKGLKNLLVNDNIELIFAEQNLLEIEIVTKKPKLQKYFNEQDVKDLLDLIRTIGFVYEIDKIPEICRDPKDNFLLGLIKKSKAKYLVTGDKDLLVLKEYKKQ